MKIILTGATGALGSQVLFELLQSRSSELEELVLVVRPKKGISPKKRIENLLSSPYAPLGASGKQLWEDKRIRVVSPEDLHQAETLFVRGANYTFVHLAGFVNLSQHPRHKEEIYKENLGFTQSLYTLLKPYLTKWVYISTAFAIGRKSGLIGNDYLSANNLDYRNYYEASKHASEQFLAERCREDAIELQILRPSVLGGNIYDSSPYFISKYMVFYLFAKFFAHMAKEGPRSIRIAAGAESNLNIIPADYAAKVICKVMDQPIDQLNIAHAQGTPIEGGISHILKAVGFQGYRLTQDLISATSGFESALEKLYYETIGIHLTPYLTAAPSEWDTGLLESILPLPQYNIQEYLQSSVRYALANNFRNQSW